MGFNDFELGDANFDFVPKNIESAFFYMELFASPMLSPIMLFKEKKQDHFINFKTIFPERVFQSLIRLHTPRQNKKEILWIIWTITHLPELFMNIYIIT